MFLVTIPYFEIPLNISESSVKASAIADLQAENVAEMKEVQKNMQGTSNDAF